MKKLLLFLFIFLCSIPIRAQDPDLYRTWYLYIVEVTDIYYVSEIDPSIEPYINITENLVFNGLGACNTFDGIYIEEFPGFLISYDFNNTNEDCGYPIHNIIEDDYFNVLQAFDYQISQDNEGFILNLWSGLWGWAELRDYPLSTIDFELSKLITIYPNPAKDILTIDNTSNTEITSINIYDVLGRIVLTEKSNMDQVDVSHLDSGLLFMEIETDQGVITKKIVKE